MIKVPSTQEHFQRKLEYSKIKSFHEKLWFADSKESKHVMISFNHRTKQTGNSSKAGTYYGNLMILQCASKFLICIIEAQIKYILIKRTIIIMDSQDSITLQLRKRW